jgi:hypothetical protein
MAKGGAPLMRGAHKTCQGSNVWQKERGGVSSRRRAQVLEEGCHLCKRKGRGVHQMGK